MYYSAYRGSIEILRYCFVKTKTCSFTFVKHVAFDAIVAIRK